MRLETQRLILRSWEDRDRAPLAAILGNPEVRRFYPTTLTFEQTSAQIDFAIERERTMGFHLGAAELKATGELIGLIGLGYIPEEMRAVIRGEPPIEIGWQFARTVWAQARAPEGARAWLDFGFESLGLPEIVAFTYRGNLPSQRVMEKIGMVRDRESDFEHPRLAPGHALRSHVVYRIGRPSPIAPR